jgi:hypothetical protein
MGMLEATVRIFEANGVHRTYPLPPPAEWIGPRWWGDLLGRRAECLPLTSSRMELAGRVCPATLLWFPSWGTFVTGDRPFVLLLCTFPCNGACSANLELGLDLPARREPWWGVTHMGVCPAAQSSGSRSTSGVPFYQT